jgi:hypothetical protein
MRREDLVDRFFEEVRHELARERAAALGRAGRRVEEARDACLALARRPEVTADAYRAALATFDEARWEFCVQREALGLYDHTWVDRIYPPPPRR